MDLQARLIEDMKTAMKAKDKVRLETVRSLRGQIKNTQIAKGRDLTDEELLQVLTSAAKKRKDAIQQYRDVGRTDRAEEEMAELKVIEAYLPAQMSPEEVAAIVAETIQQIGATSMKEMGKVMGAIMPKVKGKADGKIVQQMVKEKLAAL